jgi:hypothetical protein
MLDIYKAGCSGVCVAFVEMDRHGDKQYQNQCHSPVSFTGRSFVATLPWMLNYNIVSSGSKLGAHTVLHHTFGPFSLV